MNRMRIAAAAAVGVAAAAAFAAFALRRDGTTGDESEVGQLRREVAELRAKLGGDVRGLASIDLPAKMDLLGRPFPIDKPEVREAVAYEIVLTVGKPTMPLLWMRRAPLLLPMVEARLRQRGLPDDLKYLSMIESDLRWSVESPAGAQGPWQFMPATGKKYGLKIDKYLDERMDPDRSTDAALTYIADLQRQFGDWYLALAAYNYGENGVAKAIAEQGKRDYFGLYLPLETRRYLPRLAAAKLVYEQPEKYGLFRMAPLYVPKYRMVDVDAAKAGEDLKDVARRRGLDYALLRIHNPQLRGPALPAGRTRLRIPEGE